MGVVDTVILNGGTWAGFVTGLVVFAPLDIAGCGLILVRMAMIDADVKIANQNKIIELILIKYLII